jgi:hypothetical protein
MVKFRRCFGRMGDPRAANARHDLLELLVIALAATLCGADSCADMADSSAKPRKDCCASFCAWSTGFPVTTPDGYLAALYRR